MKYIAPLVNKLNLIIGLLFLTSNTLGYAQEVIVDVNPDQLITSSTSSYTIDMDDNGTVEFLFRVQEMSGDTVLGGQPSTYVGASAILGALNGQPAGVNDNSIFTLTNFADGEIVSAANEFGVDTSYSLGINLLIDAGIGIFPYLYGSFLGANNAFLGVSFESEGNTHYGWIELSVSSGSDSIIIHSYGYNQSVEQPVDAGGLVSHRLPQHHEQHGEHAHARHGDQHPGRLFPLHGPSPFCVSGSSHRVKMGPS